jgi:hypothetical protein
MNGARTALVVLECGLVSLDRNRHWSFRSSSNESFFVLWWEGHEGLEGGHVAVGGFRPALVVCAFVRVVTLGVDPVVLLGCETYAGEWLDVSRISTQLFRSLHAPYIFHTLACMYLLLRHWCQQHTNTHYHSHPAEKFTLPRTHAHCHLHHMPLGSMSTKRWCSGTT